MLDDAREGMDHDIRIQDDLFGHVNGRWLDTSEIPADRATWGPFALLAETAEQQVLEIIEACADGVSTSSTADDRSTAARGDEARKIGDLYKSFMDEERIERLGHTPILPLLEELFVQGALALHAAANCDNATASQLIDSIEELNRVSLEHHDRVEAAMRRRPEE